MHEPRPLKRIDQSATAEEAACELNAFEAEWGQRYGAVARMWRNNWGNVIPFFQFPPEIRKAIYTTNAIESLNMSMRKLTRNRRVFPNDAAAFKALYLAVAYAPKRWRSIHHWKPALQTFLGHLRPGSTTPRRPDLIHHPADTQFGLQALAFTILGPFMALFHAGLYYIVLRLWFPYPASPENG